jgi:hypothetical protein
MDRSTDDDVTLKPAQTSARLSHSCQLTSAAHTTDRDQLGGLVRAAADCGRRSPAKVGAIGEMPTGEEVAAAPPPRTEPCSAEADEGRLRRVDGAEY